MGTHYLSDESKLSSKSGKYAKLHLLRKWLSSKATECFQATPESIFSTAFSIPENFLGSVNLPSFARAPQLPSGKSDPTRRSRRCEVVRMIRTSSFAMQSVVL